MLLKRRKKPRDRGRQPDREPSATARMAFEGRLETLAALKLVTTLVSQEASGVLLVGGLSPARVAFEGGAMVEATAGDLEGLPALAHVLRLRAGTFRFEAAGAPPRQHSPLHHFEHGPFATAARPAGTFTARALRALQEARARLFSPRQSPLLELPRTREAAR